MISSVSSRAAASSGSLLLKNGVFSSSAAVNCSVSSSSSSFSTRKNINYPTKTINPQFPQRRFFAIDASAVTEQHQSGKEKPLEVWEEIELNRPMVPSLDGYQRPRAAPLPSQLSREQYHQFMRGKPQAFSREFRVFLSGLCVMCFIIGEMAFTMYQLKPDDFDWMEEERAKAKAAKARVLYF